LAQARIARRARPVHLFLSSSFPGLMVVLKSIVLVAVSALAADNQYADLGESNALVEDSECEHGQCALNALQLQKEALNSNDEADLNATLAFNKYGYHHWATTTMYGDAPAAACGGVSTAELVRGTPYYNVASAQSMWRNCGGTGSCWCGQSGGGGGTLGMGCFTCARGRFLSSAYGTRGWALLETGANQSEFKSNYPWPFASEEITLIVGDLCPHAGNERWCPTKPGERNVYGSYHHLDFSHYPQSIDTSRSVPNLNFVFNIIQCPEEMGQRRKRMSKCR